MFKRRASSAKTSNYLTFDFFDFPIVKPTDCISCIFGVITKSRHSTPTTLSTPFSSGLKQSFKPSGFSFIMPFMPTIIQACVHIMYCCLVRSSRCLRQASLAACAGVAVVLAKPKAMRAIASPVHEVAHEKCRRIALATTVVPSDAFPASSEVFP